MSCPRCGGMLRHHLRGSTEIDICTGCQGIWLDRGELEALNNFAIVVARYVEDLRDDGDDDLVADLRTRRRVGLAPLRRRS